MAAVGAVAVGDLAEIAGPVQEAMARFHVPGVAVGIQHGGAEYTEGFGVTSVEHPLAVDADTLFQIGSITKTITATAVLRLVEQGTLALDAPVRTYLPGLRLRDEDAANRVTLAHLLTHTAGWSGDVPDARKHGEGDDALARLAADLPHVEQLTPPGEVWHYNNRGFCVAGRVMEVVTGKTFEAAVDELVLRPLGMRRSCWFPVDVMTHRFVAGHDVRGGQPEIARRWGIPRALNPAGGVTCSVRDLLRFARLHLGLDTGSAEETARDAPLLSAATIEAMRAPRVPDALHNGCAASFGDEVGLGWFSRATPPGRLVTHGSTTTGQTARLTLVPEHGFAIAVLTNADWGAQLHGAVTRWALRQFLGIDGLEVSSAPLPEAQLAEYGGRYLFQEEQFVVTLEAHEGGLRSESRWDGELTETTTWGFYAPDRMVGLDGLWQHERCQFLRGADGRITWLRAGGRLHARAD